MSRRSSSPVHPPPQHSSRAEHFTCFARVEHGPRLVGESGRVEGGAGETLSLGLETSLQCSASDPHSLDEIAQNPLLGEREFVYSHHGKWYRRNLHSNKLQFVGL